MSDKEKVLGIFPQAYARDTKRGGFDIMDTLDRDTAMCVGYGKTEAEAWADTAWRLGTSIGWLQSYRDMSFSDATKEPAPETAISNAERILNAK